MRSDTIKIVLPPDAGEKIKNAAIEYWRESANSWLQIAAEQAEPAARLFACKCAEDSLDRMDAAKN